MGIIKNIVAFPLYENRRRGKPINYFTSLGVDAQGLREAGAGVAVGNQVPAAAASQNITMAPRVASVFTYSSIILPANTARKFLLVQNNGAVDVQINFGTAADATSYTVAAGGGVLILDAGNAPVDSVHAIATAAVNIYVVEGI